MTTGIGSGMIGSTAAGACAAISTMACSGSPSPDDEPGLVLSSAASARTITMGRGRARISTGIIASASMISTATWAIRLA